MKNKITALLCIFSVLCLLLTSCGKDAEVPDGMQVLRKSDALGIAMYAPEGWKVCNVGDISAAYVSTINQTSVTLAEADRGDAVDFADYFEKHKSEFPYEITMTSENKAAALGNADAAAEFSYTFTYSDISFRALQILATFGDRLYIFTYTSYDRTYEGTEETYYSRYFSDAQKVMDTLVFSNKSGDGTTSAPAKTDADGYVLASDTSVSGFTLYLPPEWTCNVSSGIVAGSAEDGANVNMTEATATGVSMEDYFKNRKEELSVFVEELTVIEENTKVDFPGAAWAFRYEYTYVYMGETYHVLQYAVSTRAFLSSRGYVFTYTAPAAVYGTHLDEVRRILDKVTFS